MVTLAATQGEAVAACVAHAQRWVTSAPCRRARTPGGPAAIEMLALWAKTVAAGPDLMPAHCRDA
jgi:hypothetical protein